MELLTANLEQCKSVIDRMDSKNNSQFDFNGMARNDIKALEESVTYIEKIIAAVSIDKDGNFDQTLNNLLIRLVSLVQRITHVIRDYTKTQNLINVNNRVKTDLISIVLDINDIISDFSITLNKRQKKRKPTVGNLCLIIMIEIILGILLIGFIGLVAPAMLLVLGIVFIILFPIIYFFNR